MSSKIEIQEQPGGRRERTKKRKNERALGELSDYIRKSKLRIIGIPAGEEKKKGTESLFKEIIDENFPSLWKEQDFKIEQTSNYINRKRSSLRYILFKLLKINDRG